ncbi:hypothetical protein Bca52824_035648 [Brassica carinata]|uniref:DUF1985 domain-containing protein n=1 Tax=Brassica carinata TaxID=52824 RepID=A0A8X7V2Y4_BRACI|nr:hypothetical protein Bca52824_035648 [Brassica carinata]
MAYQFPKRIHEEGVESRIDKINNTCRRTLLDAVKTALKDEYEEVLKDHVFGSILAIIENQLIYSGKIIHSFICKHLRVSNLHELWFLFAKRPLRFSMKEFYAVTGLKFKEESDVDFINWKNDKGFWATVLKTNWKINLYCVRDEPLKACNEWAYVDRVRLVYLCILQSFVMAKDWKVYIPHEYIRLVMDFEKWRMYPWGLRAYDELIASILRAREDLNTKNSYVLDGFSYAFQIWIMEAVPDIGSMGELFAFILSTGNFDVIDSSEFVKEDEKKDERVGRIVALINAKQDWKQFAWEVEVLPAHMELSDSEDVQGEDVSATHVEEPAVVSEELAVVPKRGKRKLNDLGAESRKKQLLCQRAAEHNSGVSGEMKTLTEGLFTSSFNSFKEIMQKDIHERFDNVLNDVAQLKEQVSQIKDLSETVGKGNVSEIIPNPPAAKGKGKAAASVDPTLVRCSPRSVRQDVQTDENDMLDFLQNLSKTSRYSFQEAMGNLSQASHVKGFDPSQQLNGEEQAEWVTPLSIFNPMDWRPPTLKDVESHEDRMHDPDYSLVFVHGKFWANLLSGPQLPSKELKIGPSMLTSELASRVMGPTQWLKNHRKKENHLLKWVVEALLDEMERMAEHQARVDEEIEDLRISMKKAVQEEVMNHKNSPDVGCVGILFGLLCLWSKYD